MSDERRLQIESLFDTLIDAPSDRRQVVLSSVSDPAVSAEVARLLKAHDELSSSGGDFLGRLDAASASVLVQGGDSHAIGSHIGRYPVIRALGRGGMGVVYLARDPKLGRQVAIKLLPPYLSGDADAVRRLAAEARTASALDHPNIATVYEIAETDAGQAFIVMAYYDGETLRERLAHGALYPDEALEVGIALAEALSAAHRAGIIHRDIKPENLILTRDGVLKILDFGIAKAANAELATGSLMRGTAAYMSPEQSRGDPVDQRTDIWSAGVVLHELLSGARPFGGEGEALIQAIRNEPAAPLAPTRTGVPPELVALVSRCLEKNPAARPATAAEVSAALRAIRDGRGTIHPRGRRRAVWLAGAGLAAIAVSLVLLVFRPTDRPDIPAAPPSAAPAIAVLPFEVRGADLDIWREGMADLLATNLDDVAGLRAIDSRTIIARWRRLGTGTATPDLDRAIALARETGARYALLGSVTSVGSELRIAASLHSADGGPPLTSLSVDGPADSLFSLIDRLSIDILATIWQGRGRTPRPVDLARLTTTSLPALKAYLNGERYLRGGDWSGAVTAYRQAIAADSTFAFAYYHLALASAWIGEPVISAREWSVALEKGLRHSRRLPEREQMLLRTATAVHVPTTEDLTRTLQLAQRTSVMYPDDAEAWYLLGEVYAHASDQLLASWTESERAFERSVQLDPGFSVPYIHLVIQYFNGRRDSAAVAKLIDRFRSVAPESSLLKEFELSLSLAFGDAAHRTAALSRLETLPIGAFNGATWVTLLHPRYWDVVVTALEARTRPADPDGRQLTGQLFRLKLNQGDLRAARRYLEDPLMWESVRATGTYQMKSADLAPPRALLDSLRHTPPSTTVLDTAVATPRIVLSGADAADEGRWNDFAAAVARLRTREAAWLSVNDSANARFARGSRTALSGYGALLRGDTSGGLRLLKQGHVETTWFASLTRNTLNAVFRRWIAEALHASHHYEEAVRYYGSLRWDPFAAERAAPLYEQLGRREEARESYELVASLWRDADPPLRARAELARAAARLLREPHGDRTPNTGLRPLGTASGTDSNGAGMSEPGSVNARRKSTTASTSSADSPSGATTSASSAKSSSAAWRGLAPSL